MKFLLSPKLFVSLTVSDDLSVATTYVHSLKINQKHFRHLWDHGQLKCATALVNIIAHRKALCNSNSSSGQIQLYLSLLFYLQQYLSISSQTDFLGLSKLELIEFIFEQLQFCK